MTLTDDTTHTASQQLLLVGTAIDAICIAGLRARGQVWHSTEIAATKWGVGMVDTHYDTTHNLEISSDDGFVAPVKSNKVLGGKVGCIDTSRSASVICRGTFQWSTSQFLRSRLSKLLQYTSEQYDRLVRRTIHEHKGSKQAKDDSTV